MSDSKLFEHQISLVKSINEHPNNNFTKDRDKDLAKLARKAPGLLWKLDNIPKGKCLKYILENKV